jgi:glutamate--cysteine ligase
MSRDQAANDYPLTDRAQLRAFFEQGSKGNAPRGVGTEHEKFGFDSKTLQSLAYEGPNGIGVLLKTMAERFGYTPAFDGPNILALERNGAAVTLEPGGQLELSGRITRNIFETREELALHFDEVRAIGDELGQTWSLMSLNPWDHLDAVPWMPKSRYQVMRAYMPTRGRLAHWMMKMTCTVQANFDYRDEDDAMQMLALASRVGPVITALFANSPYRLSKRGWASERMRIWQETDPDRCGVPDFFVQEGASFDDYVEWLLDVPMFFVVRDGKYVDMAGHSFRKFMAEGHNGLTATEGDWELHISTVFPDVRMKRYIEVRTADAGDLDHLLALPAIWKGLFYDDDARQYATELVEVHNAADARAFSLEASERGLDGKWRGRAIGEIASDLIDIASAGLDRQAVPGTLSERVFLDAIRAPNGRPLDPSNRMVRLWARHDGDRRAIIENNQI